MEAKNGPVIQFWIKTNLQFSSTEVVNYRYQATYSNTIIGLILFHKSLHNIELSLLRAHNIT